MLINLFDGPQVNLMDMLAARERRQERQLELLSKAPDKSLISIGLNIPGPVKTSKGLEKIFKQVLVLLLQELEKSGIDVIESHILDEDTGNQAFLVVESPALDLKKITVKVEQASPLGRLVDMDVLYLEKGQLELVSRSDLGMEPRQCYICQDNAKNCARSRKHSIEEIRNHIETIAGKDLLL